LEITIIIRNEISLVITISCDSWRIIEMDLHYQGPPVNVIKSKE
jgi:hypothetical protein